MVDASRNIAGSGSDVNEFILIQAAVGSGVYSASNRNECQKHKKSVSL
jgi:hypothetical protein